MTDALCTKLPNRASVVISGEDSRPFLQNLITQDLTLLDTQPLVYSCLLTPQGKFLFDFFVRCDEGKIILDCEGEERALNLFKRLNMYKLRSKVEIELNEKTNVWQIWNGTVPDALPDPRHESCGQRSYTHLNEAKDVAFDQWDEHRIKNEIPDGSRDLIPEKSFIHEGRLDDFNAVSYKKGCFIGQELVSRMHHRGLTKKILKCVNIEAIPEGADLRSHCNGVGLALVRL